MLVSYPHAWLPVVVVVGTVLLLTTPYLALIALMALLIVFLAALAAAIVLVSSVVGRYARLRWRKERVARTLPRVVDGKPTSPYTMSAPDNHESRVLLASRAVARMRPTRPPRTGD